MRYNGYLLTDYAEEHSLLFKPEQQQPSYIIDAYKENIKNIGRDDTIIVINPGNVKINQLQLCLISYKTEGEGENFEDWFEVEITDR